MSWICIDTNFKHEHVPLELIQEAERKAIAAIEEEQMG